MGHMWGSMGFHNIRRTTEDEVHLDHQHRGRCVDPRSSPTDRDLAGRRSCATTLEDMEFDAPPGPAVERSELKTPRAILQRPKTTLIKCRKVETSDDKISPSDTSPSNKSPSEIQPLDLASVASEESDRSSIADGDSISHVVTVEEAQDLTEVDPHWIHAYRSFGALESKITTTPILRHFDPDRRATVVVYGSDWAISGSLMQEYDKIYHPVMFATRTLKTNELNYGIAGKEVLVLLRILDLNYNALVARLIHGLTRHSGSSDLRSYKNV
ncbi:reverse transcriptase [Phytophthora megakarya]|uniref:Reverse transcriptase n=1 Tax=Phytophthora megakarya TaxID=4795 RepID=A0A225W7P4_9STRA|nr:reverse transcriptase [Phytophthora megakarya]